MTRIRSRLKWRGWRHVILLLIVTIPSLILIFQENNWDCNENFLFKWDSAGAGQEQFKGACGIAVDISGNVYIANSYYDFVKVYDKEGNYFRSLSASFGTPFKIACNAPKYVYVTDQSNMCVLVFDETGQLVNTWGSSGSENGQLSAPEGIAVNAAGEVFVADVANKRIQVFTSSGQFIKKFDLGGYPGGIAIAPNGDIYVSLYNTGVKKISAKDGSITTFAPVLVCSGLVIDAMGFVYILDKSQGCINVYNPSGILIDTWGSGQMNSPWDIALGNNGRIFVLDSGNDRVQVFSVAIQLKPEASTGFNILLAFVIIYLTVIVGVPVVRKKVRSSKVTPQAISQVERVVLELAPQLSKLQVGEIAEKCGVSNENLIITVIRQMIARKEIHAEYFKSTKSVAFQQRVIEKPFSPEAPEVATQFLEMRRQYEYTGGKVRIKITIINTGNVGLLRVTCMLNIPDSFRLLRVDPSEYHAEGSALKLQDFLPKEEKVVAFVLEPMICGKEQLSGTVSGVVATGDPFASSIVPLEVEVVCPLFANPEETNLPSLQRIVADLPVKSERVFYLPETLSPANAFELAKSAISERDVRFVGILTPDNNREKGPFDQSAWFYGTTKVGKKRFIFTAEVSELKHIIRLSTACDDEAGCTGFLAETGAAIRRELVRRGAFENENKVIELVCEKCGSTLPSAPTNDNDVRCPECQWSWRATDFFN